VLSSESPSLHAIFGSPDNLKFRSCMTLFSLAVDDVDNPFRQALDRWCSGQPDEQTLKLIGMEASHNDEPDERGSERVQ
jgi:uncharacterized protein (DUF1810 family)